MMQLANSTFYMSGAEARLSPNSRSSSRASVSKSHRSSSASSNGGKGGNEVMVSGPATATVHKLRKAERSSSRASTTTATPVIATAAQAEEEASPDEMAAQSSSSAPISPTLSPSSRLMLKRKQINASMALRSPQFSTSSSASSTSSSAASSLVSFGGGSSSKSNSLKRMSPEEENLASRLRNLQISELIDAILLVEGKLKREQKMIAGEIRSRDLQISQQLKEIERYRGERKQNLCGFCQKKMESVASCGGGEKQRQHQLVETSGHRVREQRNVEVQTETDDADVVLRRGLAKEIEEEADDDWYANGNSDNENEKSSVNLYERGVNPVLERVNQILQQSTDDAEAAAIAAATTMTPTAEVVRAAQHSVQQQQQHHRHKSLQHIPQVKVTPRIPEISKTTPVGKCAPIVVKRPPVSTPILHAQMAQMRAHSSPMSVTKENEYEVIGSEQDSSNYYMDMQSPIDRKTFAIVGPREVTVATVATIADEVEYKNVLSRKEGLELLKLIAPHPGMPPALPPKPANLMKFKKVVPPTTKNIFATSPKMGSSGGGVVLRGSAELNKSVASEPDYCSISECEANNGAKKRSPQMGINDDDIDETTSKASEDTLDNIPKLPNVAAIIVPKKLSQQQQQSHMLDFPSVAVGGNGSSNNNAVINKDNYISKSVMSMKTSPGGASMPVTSSPKDLPLLIGGDSPKRVPHSPLRSAASATLDRRQNLMHRLSMQHTHHGTMMKRYSMDALSPQIQPDEVKCAGGAFDERIPIQAEFDWYNLDAEFGKFNAHDVIKEKSSGSESGSVSGGEEEKRRPTAKSALDRGLGELREIERKMTTLERKRANELRKDSANKEMVHFC